MERQCLCGDKSRCTYKIADHCPVLRAEFRKPGVTGKDFQLRNKRYNQRKRDGRSAIVILKSNMDDVVLTEDGGRVIYTDDWE